MLQQIAFSFSSTTSIICQVQPNQGANIFYLKNCFMKVSSDIQKELDSFRHYCIFDDSLEWMKSYGPIHELDPWWIVDSTSNILIGQALNTAYKYIFNDCVATCERLADSSIKIETGLEHVGG